MCIYRNIWGKKIGFSDQSDCVPSVRLLFSSLIVISCTLLCIIVYVDRVECRNNVVSFFAYHYLSFSTIVFVGKDEISYY